MSPSDQPDFLIYYAIDLVMIGIFAHQQFNGRSRQPESNIVLRLAQSQIIPRSTFYAASLVYLLAIAVVYSLLCLSPRAFDIARTVFNVVAEQLPGPSAEIGATAIPAPDSAAAGEATQAVGGLDRNVPLAPGGFAAIVAMAVVWAARRSADLDDGRKAPPTPSSDARSPGASTSSSPTAS